MRKKHLARSLISTHFTNHHKDHKHRNIVKVFFCHEVPAWGYELACQLLFRIIPLDLAGLHGTSQGPMECVSL